MRNRSTKQNVAIFIEFMLWLALGAALARGCNAQNVRAEDVTDQGVIVVTRTEPYIIELLWLDPPQVTNEGQLAITCTLLYTQRGQAVLDNLDFTAWFYNAFYLEINLIDADGTVLACHGEQLITGETAELFQPISFDFTDLSEVYISLVTFD